MDFFYTPPYLITPDLLTIEGDEYIHLTHVMRKKAGDALAVVDGEGNRYDVVIRNIERRAAFCDIVSRTHNAGESGVEVHLGVGVLKSSTRFDYLVEKATELGVSSITPLATLRVVKRHAKRARWQKIALAAMKQSGRSVLPRIDDLTPLDQFLRDANRDSVRITLHEKAKTPIGPVLSGRAKSVVVCVGPEGGFTDEEIDASEAAGFSAVLIAPRRLRTDTAAIVAVSLCTGSGEMFSEEADPNP